MPLENFLVRILVHGKHGGAGFFLTPERLVTCLHCLGTERVEDVAEITFTFAGESDKPYPVRVDKIEILPGHDLAILTVEDTAVHARLRNIPLPRIISIFGRGPIKTETLGYPSPPGTSTRPASPTYIGTRPANPTYIGQSLPDDGPRRLHFNDANTITRGFSGAPLIVNEQYLIGVVQIIFNEDEHQRGHDIAEAIPADILKEHFPAQYDDTCRYYLDQPTFRDLKRGSNRTNSLSHFRFTEQKTAFACPTGVKEALHDFCHSSNSFSWWLIIGGAGTGKSRTALELCEILKKEGWIDPRKRPLFAMLLASYLGDPRQEGEDITQDAVLEHVIAQEFQRILEPARIDPDEGKARLEALCISTLTGGKAGDFPLADRTDPLRRNGLCHVTDGDNHLFRFYPLEPDLVGEYFILEGGGREEDAKDALRRITDKDMASWIWTAWQEDSLATAEFFVHCAQDFPSRPEWVEKRFLPIGKQLKTAKLAPDDREDMRLIYDAASANMTAFLGSAAGKKCLTRFRARWREPWYLSI